MPDRRGLLLDAAQKRARPFVPDAVYRWIVDLYYLIIGQRALRPGTYPRMRRLKAAPIDDAAAEPFELPTLDHPILLRPGTPDVAEVLHTVVRSTYGRWLPTTPVRLVVDAGAYIGDTTAWYLSRFPAATVVALEPNPRSFTLLERNCRPYGSRAILHRAALWTHRTRLELRHGTSGTIDASVNEVALPPQISCEGVTVDDVLAPFGDQRVDIFKCDIEGAETTVFSATHDHWMQRVDHVYVDIHGAASERAVIDSARRHGFGIQRWRELLVLSRR